jgi:excisionase family DNA binding protein
MYLTFAEACERLRLSHETVRRLIKSGLLEAHKSGTARNSHYRISEQAIADYIQRQTAQAAR